MKKLMIITSIFVAISLSIFLAYNKYQDFKIKELIKSSSKISSLLVNNALKLYSGNSNITYKDYFEKLDSDISEIDKRIIAIQAILNQENQIMVTPTVEYLQGLQELLRSLKAMVTKEKEYESAVQIAEKAHNENKRSSGIIANRLNSEFMNKAIEDMVEAEEAKTKSTSFFRSAITRQKELCNKLSSIMPKETLADVALFEKIEKDLLNEEKDSLANKKTDTQNNTNDKDGSLKINFVDYRERFVSNKKEGNLFIIEGKLINNYDHPRSNISITGKIFSDKKELVQQKTIFAGNMISNSDLSVLSFDEIARVLSNPQGLNGINVNIPSGKEIPFMVVFSNLPNNLDNYSVEVVKSL